MRINTNIPALRAQSRLEQTTKALARSLQRLASGRRINRAADDASGLSISEGLTAQIRGFRAATQSVNQALSVLNTAESALNTQLEIVQRMRELAVQASNGTISNTDRSYLNTELDQLFEEYNRIVEQTQFNDLTLFKGQTENLQIQAGANSSQSININIPSIEANEVFLKQVATGEYENTYATESDVNDEVLFAETLDVNGDDNLDLIEIRAETGVGFVRVVQLGDGEGNFAESERETLISNPSPALFEPIQAGDFNGDGLDDLFFLGPSSYGLVQGLGNGEYKANDFILGSFNSSDIQKVADINQDGIVDIITADQPGAVGLNLEVYIGSGDGTFDLETTFSNGVTFAGRGLEVADIDNDGDLDIVSSGSLLINVLENDGNLNFSQVEQLSDGQISDIFGLEDMNGDGFVDIVGSDGIRLNDGDGSFGSVIFEDMSSTESSKILDINQDGHLDLIIESGGLPSEVRLYHGDGQGNLTVAQTYEGVGLSYAAIAEDLTSDGFTDFYFGGFSSAAFTASTRQEAGVDRVDISTQQAAQLSLETFDGALEKLLEARVEIGAATSRLESALNSMFINSENLSAARTLISDTDIAAETAELTKQQILQQASVSVLSQANSSLQIVLELLRF